MSKVSLQLDDIAKKVIPIEISQDTSLNHSCKQSIVVDDVSENTTNFTSE